MPDSILDATVEQLRSAQAKITYLGEQSKPIPTIIFHTRGYRVNLSDFLAVQKTGRPYANDDLPYTRRVPLEPTEFRKILQSLKPTLKSSDGGGPEFLSFTVLRTWNTKTAGQEFRIGTVEGREFFTKLTEGINPENVEARSAVNTQFLAIFP